jgi:hypothetical protein
MKRAKYDGAEESNFTTGLIEVRTSQIDYEEIEISPNHHSTIQCEIEQSPNLVSSVNKSKIRQEKSVKLKRRNKSEFIRDRSPYSQ